MNTQAMLARGRAAIAFLTAGLLAVMTVANASAQDDTFSQYREMMGEDNPAIFVSEEGADYWSQPGGPRQVSLEQCDLGLGPGVVEGAYAGLPRYFDDAERVMDLEARLLHCMVQLQGRTWPDVSRKPYSKRGDMGTELEALVTYVAEQSQGEPLAVPQDNPAEIAAYLRGQDIFYRRMGPYDFSCASCHRQDNRRIRLQELPNITTAEGAGLAYSTWPAYRVSQGLVRTMGWRMQNCARQQRLPQLQPGSDASVALQVFIAVNAEKTEMAAPGMKR